MGASTQRKQEVRVWATGQQKQLEMALSFLPVTGNTLDA
jgi:hypothetical protein